MNKESKLNLNAGDYAISHCDSDKTYNGLEVHKMLCDAYIAGNNDTLDDEDERIRKELLEHCINRRDGKQVCVDANDYRRWAAWLEKQEGCEYIKKDWLEHIKQSWYKEGFIDGKYSGGTSKEWTINDAATLKELIDFLENGTAKLQHDLTRYANWLKNQFTPIEKQGEQKSQRMISAEAKEAMYDKPADTVEPKFKVGDKIYLKPEYRMPDDDTPIANTVKEIRRIDDKHYRFDGSYIFIEDQDKYELVEQKPKENKGNIGGISPDPEWSEENEPQKELAESYLAKFDEKFPILPTLKGKQLADYKNFLNKCQQIFRLKYWGIRPIQAKLFEKLSLLWAAWGAEHLQGLGQTDGDMDDEILWSEEDEKMLDSVCISINEESIAQGLRSRGDSYSIEDLTTIRSKQINWIKSIKGRVQPQWKPSDEQIAQLQIVIDTYGNEGICDPILTELLFQLKKLRGKV